MSFCLSQSGIQDSPKLYLYNYEGHVFAEAMESYLLHQHAYNLVCLYHHFYVG